MRTVQLLGCASGRAVITICKNKECISSQSCVKLLRDIDAHPQKNRIYTALCYTISLSCVVVSETVRHFEKRKRTTFVDLLQKTNLLPTMKFDEIALILATKPCAIVLEIRKALE